MLLPFVIIVHMVGCHRQGPESGRCLSSLSTCPLTLMMMVFCLLPIESMSPHFGESSFSTCFAIVPLYTPLATRWGLVFVLFSPILSLISKESPLPMGERRLGSLEKPQNVASAPQRGASSHSRRRTGERGSGQSPISSMKWAFFEKSLDNRLF